MLDFIIANSGTIIAGAAVLACVAAAVIGLFVKKKGKCSCGCSDCPFSGKCQNRR